jgi:hypothetical protein
MGRHNSLEIYISLHILMFHDVAKCYPLTNEIERDIACLQHRVHSEGFSFLTKTLPSFGKAIDMALSSGRPLSIQGFKTLPDSVIPKFLGWLLESVFTSDGYVRNDADVTALRHLRQLMYFVYKLEVPYDSSISKEVLESFIRTDQEISALQIPPDCDRIIRFAGVLITRVLGGVNARDIIPRHGPGAVATGETTGEKAHFKRIYTPLECVYPFTEYFTVGLSHVSDQYDWIQGLEVLEHPTAKVVLVPKDSRGPRIISCEPLEIQWIQQGIRQRLYDAIESHPLTSGRVNFLDQSVNRRLALEGSLTQQWVTLDMKDASDRVSLDLVERLFQGTMLLDALRASRSTHTQLPDGRLVKLGKFSPMGSALCFPVEAMCFWALAVAVLHKHGRSLRHCLRTIHVYGDDIIVARKDYALLLQWFPKVGLMFNSGKCCVSGFFRESCGCDAFKGVDVTPIRLRKTWSHRNIRDASALCSYVALSNALYTAGYWMSCEFIRKLITRRYGPIPSIPVGCETMLGFCDIDPNHHARNRKMGIPYRFCKDTHQMMYRTWSVYPKHKKFVIDGWRELLRVLNTGSSHLDAGVYAMPRRIILKRGWRVMLDPI